MEFGFRLKTNNQKFIQLFCLPLMNLLCCAIRRHMKPFEYFGILFEFCPDNDDDDDDPIEQKTNGNAQQTSKFQLDFLLFLYFKLNYE